MRRPSLSCQVEGCTADLGTLRPYFQRQHICEDHARADQIPDGHGGWVRFCQQCTKLEPITAFDGKKRSCQASLVKRHHRRSGGGKRNYAGHARSATTGRYGRDDQGAAALAAMGLFGGAPASLGAATEERSVTSQQPTGTTTRSGSASRGGPADTAARSLAVLADAALPDEDEEQQLGQQGLPLLPPMGPLPLSLDLPSISYDARGSGILGKPQPVRPLPLGTGAPAPFGQPALPPGSATSGWSSLPPAAALPLFNNFGAPAAPPNGSTAPALGLASAAGVGSNPDVTSLLAVLAARQAEAGMGSQPEQVGSAAAAAAAAAPKQEPSEHPADLQQLLTALQMLQQLQQSITNVVVAQLQQHLARQEASSLLEQRLLPLLGSIRAQLGPKGDSGSLSQLEQLVSSLHQLSDLLQPPPAAQDQRALGLLQWLQTAGAMAGGASGPAASAAAAPSPAPSPAVASELPAAAGGNSEEVQAMLRRVAGLLKLQKELGTA